MNRTDAIKVLRRRREHLHVQLQAIHTEANGLWRGESYMRSEAAALTWVLDHLASEEENASCLTTSSP